MSAGAREIVARARRVSTGIGERLEKRRESSPLLDVAYALFERDRDTDGTIVASAVALRVFLFFIPLLLVVVAALGFAASFTRASDVSYQVGVTGGLANQIDTALHQSSNARWLALLSGVWGLALAGRSLARVLIASSRRSWLQPAREVSASRFRVVAALAGMISGAGALTIIANRARQAAGVVGGSAAVITAAVAYSAAWFVVSVALPHGESDRSALFPGAVLVGTALAGTQYVLQFTVPGQISRASELYGAIGVVVVSLTWFFVVGRLFVVSFTLDAVIWERFGSVTTVLLRWKRFRHTVERHPRVRRFLGVSPDADGARESPAD
jgi:uncharacterized BrkB/YihY/UPF0761 family membrane protein